MSVDVFYKYNDPNREQRYFGTFQWYKAGRAGGWINNFEPMLKPSAEAFCHNTDSISRCVTEVLDKKFNSLSFRAEYNSVYSNICAYLRLANLPSFPQSEIQQNHGTQTEEGGRNGGNGHYRLSWSVLKPNPIGIGWRLVFGFGGIFLIWGVGIWGLVNVQPYHTLWHLVRWLGGSILLCCLWGYVWFYQLP
jgi:hypothetical protein